MFQEMKQLYFNPLSQMVLSTPSLSGGGGGGGGGGGCINLLSLISLIKYRLTWIFACI